MWLALGIVPFAYLLTMLSGLAIRFPAASVPAILGALFGYYRGRRSGIQIIAVPSKMGELIYGHTVGWGIIGGALGYAAFAAGGVGVPAPDASLVWRLFGGMVFGAAAGAGAGSFLPLLIIPFELVALKRRTKRAA